MALRYPYAEIHDSTDYLRIGIIGYEASGIGSKKLGTTEEVVTNKTNNTETKIKSTPTSFKPGRKNRKAKIAPSGDQIFLPIPSNIQDGNSVNFGPGSMDGLTAGALNYAMGLMDVDNYTSVSDFLTKGLLRGGLDLFDGPAQDFFLRNLASQAANIPFGGNLTAAQLLAREKGQVLNPNMELLFEGVNLRSFKFSFKLTPRGPREAKEVKQIIRTLKKSMCPSGEKTVYLNTPKIFELTYMQGSKEHPFLHKFKQCALTDMSVNYTGEGTYATYGGAEGIERGVPVSMIMDLSFKELEPIYAGDYEDETNADGTVEVPAPGGVGY